MEVTYIAEIRHPQGIEMRAGMLVVDCAARLYEGYNEKIDFKIRIKESSWTESIGKEADARSIMQVSMLAMACGTRVEVIASSVDDSGIKQGELEEAAETLRTELSRKDFGKGGYDCLHYPFTVVGFS